MTINRLHKLFVESLHVIERKEKVESNDPLEKDLVEAYGDLARASSRVLRIQVEIASRSILRGSAAA